LHLFLHFSSLFSLFCRKTENIFKGFLFREKVFFFCPGESEPADPDKIETDLLDAAKNGEKETGWRERWETMLQSRPIGL